MPNASDEESQEVREDCKIEIFLQPVSQQIVTLSQSILEMLDHPWRHSAHYLPPNLLHHLPLIHFSHQQSPSKL